jgi:hypothetical protein
MSDNSEIKRFGRILVSLEEYDNCCRLCNIQLRKSIFTLGYGLLVWYCEECNRVTIKNDDEKV